MTFDQGGWLVCEVKYDRPIGEVLDELDHAGLANRLRAARQLADDLRPRSAGGRGARARARRPGVALGPASRRPRSISGAPADRPRREALEKALGSEPNPRVRRASRSRSARRICRRSDAALRKAIETDRAEDVIGAAEISLGRIGGSGDEGLSDRSSSRASSRWWDSIRVGAVQGLGKLEDPSLATVFSGYTDPKYVQELRAAAVAGWAAAAPDDPKLAERLRALTSDRNRSIREDAVEASRRAAPRVRSARFCGRSRATRIPTIARFATEGVEETEKFVKR